MVLTIRETCMVAIAVVLSISIGVLQDWNYSKLMENSDVLSYFLVAGVIGALVYGFKPRAESFFKSHDKFVLEKSKPEIVITESLADKQKDRDEYTKHLREDILGIIESQTTNKKSQFADAIRKTKTNKKMILQHLFTYERASFSAPPIYTRYVEICEADNEFANSGFRIGELKLDLEIEITKLNDLDKDIFLNVDYQTLFEILGFPRNSEFNQKTFDLDKVRITQERQVGKMYFFVFEETDDPFHKYHIMHDRQTIATTSSKKQAEKFLQLLLKYCPKIVKTVSDIKLQKDTSIRINRPAFDQMFSHIRETILVGKPNIGVCDACASYFPHGDKMHYRKFLANFNWSPWNWAEDFWGKH